MTTQEPEPTRELDMTQLAQEAPEQSVAEEQDIVEGEPGWDSTDPDPDVAPPGASSDPAP